MVAWFFTIYTIWTVLLSALYTVKSSKLFVSNMIRFTKWIDKDWFYDIPLLMTMVRAFVIPQSTAFLENLQDETFGSIAELESRIQKNQQKLEQEQEELTQLRGAHEAAKQQD